MKILSIKENYLGKLHYRRGQAMLTAVLFFVVITLVIVIGVSAIVLEEMRTGFTVLDSKESYFLTEAGIEDVVFRLKSGKQVGSPEVLSLNGSSATTLTTNTATGKQISSTSGIKNHVRKMRANIFLGTGVSFHYGIQAGDGGFSLSNSSSVTGNIYASGPITGSGNLINGDAISVGAAGLIKGVHVTGSAYAHTLGYAGGASTQVDQNGYYQTVASNVTVGGTRYPGSSDQSSSPLPISDEQIVAWENDAAAGGTLASSFCDSYNSSSNTCTITSSKTLGPKKIPFNLTIKSSSAVFTVTGPLWVTGNITAETGPTIKMSSSLGGTNVAIIADNPADTTSSGVIDIGQNTIFEGSGTPGSFVFMISQNNSAENGGTNSAITMGQGASALVAYASHGLVTLSQSVNVKEVTAYKINLTQSASVTYDTGLPSTLFAAGPSGGYNILNWKEVQ